MPLALLLCACLALPSSVETARAAYGVQGGVRAMAIGLDGSLWFIGGNGQLGRVKPDGSFETLERGLDGHGQDLAIDADGNFWGAGPGSLARMAPSGAMTRFPLPEGLGEPTAIAAAPSGIWFVSRRLGERVPGRPEWTGLAYVGRVAADGRVESFPLPGEAGARTSAPSAIALGPDGSLWVADQSLAKIDRVSPDGQITSFALPSAPTSLTAGPEGAVWYIAGRQIGRLSPGGDVTEFHLPARGGTSIVAGPDGNLWFGGWSVGRMTPWGQVSYYPVDGYPVTDLVAGRDGSVWAGTIGNPIKWAPGSVAKLPTGKPGVELASVEAVVRGGRFALVLECGGSPTRGCAGMVEFGREGKADLGSYAIPPESRRTVRLRLPAAAQRRLARQRFWRQRFRVTVDGGEVAAREVVLRVPRPLRWQPPSGRAVRIPLPEDLEAGALTRRGGDLWFADQWGNRIVRMTPRGEFRSYRLPAPARQPRAATAGPLRSIWFLTERTKEGRRSPALARLSADGEFSEIPLPGEIPGSDLVAGPDGSLWVARTGNRAGEIDRVTPAGEVGRFPVREPGSIARGPGASGSPPRS